jgi:hypothetical protein
VACPVAQAATIRETIKIVQGRTVRRLRLLELPPLKGRCPRQCEEAPCLLETALSRNGHFLTLQQPISTRLLSVACTSSEGVVRSLRLRLRSPDLLSRLPPMGQLIRCQCVQMITVLSEVDAVRGRL